MAHVLVLMTAGSEDEAGAIARTLVEERLAACVNMVGGLTSHYRWEGKLCTDREWLLLAKTRRELLPRLEVRVRSLHSYTTPEIIAVPIDGGSESYLRWLDEATR
ncbi:MAG: divalent-cation tolerance protein CutA [Planctomycetota bacterium]